GKQPPQQSRRREEQETPPGHQHRPLQGLQNRPGIASLGKGSTSQDGEHPHPYPRRPVHEGQPVSQPYLQQRTDPHHEERPLHQAGGFCRSELKNFSNHHRQRHRIGHQKNQPLQGGNAAGSPTPFLRRLHSTT